MGVHISTVDVVCLLISVIVVASLVTGKAVYIGRGWPGPRLYKRTEEPRGYWASLAILVALLIAVVGVRLGWWGTR